MLCELRKSSKTWNNGWWILYSFSDNPGLSGRFFVTALPTIFHVTNGEFRRYTGTRDMNSFMTFVEEKKWVGIDPIDSWKRPDSIPMSILSWFFRLSHFLKVSHHQLHSLIVSHDVGFFFRSSTTHCWRNMAFPPGLATDCLQSSPSSSGLLLDFFSFASSTSSVHKSQCNVKASPKRKSEKSW